MKSITSSPLVAKIIFEAVNELSGSCAEGPLVDLVGHVFVGRGGGS